MLSYKDYIKKHWREVVLAAFFLAAVFVWVAVWQGRPGPLKVSFLDVGQGDALLIETPTHKRLLLDGGPNKGVLSEIGKILPFGARTIEVVMESHPDKDHIEGLPEVINRYKVGVFIEPGVESDNMIDDLIHTLVATKEIPNILARRGMVLNFGDGVKLLILFPNQDVSTWETNDASIVAKLVYGETSFLLTGDSPIKAENILLKFDPTLLDSDVLKAGHHGSRTSSSASYVAAVSPSYAVISAGKGNSYGHPHQEVLEILKKAGTEILSTIEKGTIRFESDGATLKLK